MSLKSNAHKHNNNTVLYEISSNKYPHTDEICRNNILKDQYCKRWEYKIPTTRIYNCFSSKQKSLFFPPFNMRLEFHVTIAVILQQWRSCSEYQLKKNCSGLNKLPPILRTELVDARSVSVSCKQQSLHRTCKEQRSMCFLSHLPAIECQGRVHRCGKKTESAYPTIRWTATTNV